MRLRRAVIGITLLSSAVSVAPQVASATHCANYTSPVQTSPPVVVISSGYKGVGGAGPLGSYGCVAGNEVADTRLIYPRADLVVLVLARVSCTPNTSTISTGTLNGLGISATGIALTCRADALGRTSYVGDVFYLDDPESTGTITGSVTIGTTKYTGTERKLI